MNIENLKKVREDIANAPEEHCDMDTWQCGSVMCIGGFAATRMMAEGHDGNIFVGAAAKWLGMKNADLFLVYPASEPKQGWKAWMLARLDKIIETGVIEPIEER